MGIIVNKEKDENTELSERIAADLREKAQEASALSDPDLADAEFLKNTKNTSRFSYWWFLLIPLFLCLLLLIIVK